MMHQLFSREVSVRPVWETDYRGIYRVGRVARRWPRGPEEFDAGAPAPPLGVAAILGRHVVGYGFYRVIPRGGRFEIVTIVVDPRTRRMGVATALLRRIAAVASSCGFARLLISVSERDDDGIRFLAARGMESIHVERGKYLDADGYRFTLELGMPVVRKKGVVT